MCSARTAATDSLIESTFVNDPSALQWDRSNPSSAADPLKSLHIVLAGLNENDVQFFYKQQDVYGISEMPDASPGSNSVPTTLSDGTELVGSARYAGYILIKSTGETLVLPNGAWDRQFSGNSLYATSTPNQTTGLLYLPSSFSITFADGSTVSGQQAAALFTQAGPDQAVEFDIPRGIASHSLQGPLQNAPDQYLGAEQNSGGAAPTPVTAAAGQTTVTGDAGANVIHPAGIATTATGGGGDDTYVYKAGYGGLGIDNFDAANDGNEGTVSFGQGITAASLAFATGGASYGASAASPSGAGYGASTTAPSTGLINLVITVNDGHSGDTITVKNAFDASGAYRIKGLSFADGSSLPAANIAIWSHTDPLFDSAYYLSHNPDVAAAGVDPLQRYLTIGWKQGRNPDALFDTNYYLSQNPDPDVAAGGVNPLQHYEIFGWKEGRNLSLAFSTSSYEQANPDVAAAGVDPLQHYFVFGQHEGRLDFIAGTDGQGTADPLVDPVYYFPQLAAKLGASVLPSAAEQTPGAAAESYDRLGWHLGLNPDPLFNTNYYLSQNPDVARAGVDPLQHYEIFGWKEGRNPSAAFSTAKYEAANPDVAAAGGDPLLHYVVFGQHEGRAIFPV